jgi:hypothetical protein
MARYQFRNLDGSPVTAEQLVNFIPALIPHVKLAEPIKPVKPANATVEQIIAYNREMEVYHITFVQHGIAQKIEDNIYKRQFADFAAVLANTFIFVTGAYFNRTWSWRVLPDVKYTFLQAAERLIKFTGDKTAFVINSYFGW